MKIAVLSGKGGTGKTFVSVNLANIIKDAEYIDCDVEEPNGRLFFKPENVISRDVNVLLPKQDINKCNGCRKCVDFCKFNALCYVNKKVIVFDEVCHSCEGCKLVCENNAITMAKKRIGVIEEGIHKSTLVKTGVLDMGEASGVPIIRELLKDTKRDNVVIDCPPGSACVVMESIKDADYCVLVSEPTIFGLSNLKMVFDLVKLFKKKFGVVINKAVKGETLLEDFCKKENIDVIAKIDFSKELGLINSNGEIISDKNKEYRDIFENMYNNIVKVMK